MALLSRSLLAACILFTTNAFAATSYRETYLCTSLKGSDIPILKIEYGMSSTSAELLWRDRKSGALISSQSLTTSLKTGPLWNAWNDYGYTLHDDSGTLVGEIEIEVDSPFSDVVIGATSFQCEYYNSPMLKNAFTCSDAYPRSAINYEVYLRSSDQSDPANPKYIAVLQKYMETQPGYQKLVAQKSIDVMCAVSNDINLICSSADGYLKVSYALGESLWDFYTHPGHVYLDRNLVGTDIYEAAPQKICDNSVGSQSRQSCENIKYSDPVCAP